MQFDSDQLDTLYTERFGSESGERAELWQVLCTDFFQKWVPEQATVLDLAAGHCEFINNIKAGRRIAIDANTAVVRHAAAGVESHVCRSNAMTKIVDDEVDVVFVRNFFDHITPIDDRALAEALVASGFEVQKTIPRFLPYTTKGRLPSGPALVRLYLRLPIAWRVLGAQAFMVARSRGALAAHAQQDDRRG
ncbi:MAG: SAM-dependent methyltransferase [Actinomycetota bacterium]